MMSLMKFVRGGVATAICAAAVVAVAIAAPAQPATPQAFLDAIYKTYVGKDSMGIGLESDAEIRSYFDKPLADAIIKDLQDAEKSKQAPLLDGDPFVDAQDWEITNLAVNVKTDGAAAAVGTVTFTNTGKPVTITLDLVRPPVGWRIADIKAPSGSLRALFKLK